MEGLRPDAQRQWGKMNVAQMLAHNSAWLEMASGGHSLPWTFMGHIFGRMVKKSFLGEAPIRRNIGTMKSLLVEDDRQFSVEKDRLIDWISRFSFGGPEKCTKKPHSFFGPMTPDEWARLAYKHLDHHLQQFGA
jgi:hypothetical protein